MSSERALGSRGEASLSPRFQKESYKISMKRIWYELSLDYVNEIEKMLSMLNVDSIREGLESKEKFPIRRAFLFQHQKCRSGT